MTNVFAEISSLDSVEDIILLSRSGEMLYGQLPAIAETAVRQIDYWKELIGLLKHPVSAEFFFDDGLYYLQQMHLGFLVTAVNRPQELSRLQQACENLQSKLSENASRKKILVQILSQADDLLKPHIINELIPFADKEVARYLLEELKKYRELNRTVRDEIIILAGQALGHCHVPGVIGALRKFKAHYAKGTAKNPSVEQAIDVSIRQLELTSNTLEAESDEKENTPEVPRPAVAESPPSGKNKPLLTGTKEEKRINKLVTEGKKREAGLALLKMIETIRTVKISSKRQITLPKELSQFKQYLVAVLYSVPDCSSKVPQSYLSEN